MEIGEMLKSLREKHHLTQEELAERVAAEPGIRRIHQYPAGIPKKAVLPVLRDAAG